jgi:hypothetical protein
MHKYSYIGMRLSKGRAGFLLPECIIAFGVLSIVLVVIAHTFFVVVRSYAQVKMRLDALCIAQNIVEHAWLDKKNTYDVSQTKASITEVVVKAGIILPAMPVYKQKNVCVQYGNSNKKICLQMRGLKEM